MRRRPWEPATAPSRTPSDFLYLNSLYIADNAPDEVNVYADNFTGGSPSVNAIAQIICDTDAGPGVYRLRQTGFKNVPDAREVGATARCRNGESVVGGAVYNQGVYADESYINSTGPVDLGDKDKVPDDGWHGELNNDEDASGTRWTCKVSAFCDTKHNNVHYRSKTTKLERRGPRRRHRGLQSRPGPDRRRSHLGLGLPARPLHLRHLQGVRRLGVPRRQLADARRQEARDHHDGDLPGVT